MKDELNQVFVEHLALSVTGKLTFGSAVIGLFGYLTDINWIGLSAVLFGFIGMAANIYFLVRRDRRERRESEVRIRSLSERLKK